MIEQGSVNGVVVHTMFRRGRRHEATTEPSSPGVDEPPQWLLAEGVEPKPVQIAPKAALLRYDTPPWLADKEGWIRRHVQASIPSPLRGVSTEEVLDALGSVPSPAELDWELVGVAFVYTSTDPITPARMAVDLVLEAPPWADEVPTSLDVQPAEAQPAPELDPAFEVDPTPEADPAFEVYPLDDAQPAPAGTPAPGVTAALYLERKQRKWLPEHDAIMTAVGDLSWEGYRSLIADMFRREGYEVFGGEGPDGDVIDMEIVRGTERMLVNCQLRGLTQIGVEPLSEMAQVATRSGADGVFLISDGDFVPEAWSMASGQHLTLIDRDALLSLILEFTLGAGHDRTVRAHMRRLLSGLQSRGKEWAN
ncbi:MAG: restriction endonuclease [Candidatus Dormibacteraeota bacterium]|nr:restriction endonuclease [Candidatus Dormibacteraeota bacterium]